MGDVIEDVDLILTPGSENALVVRTAFERLSDDIIYIPSFFVQQTTFQD